MEAVIFDLDGTLVDTQRIHSLIESELLKKYDINITPKEITKKYAGRKTEEFFRELLASKIPYNQINKIIEQLMKEKWERMLNYINNEDLKLNEGALELILILRKRGIKLAVASSSIHSYVIKVLEKTKILNYFEVILGGNNVKREKPYPDIFLKAANLLEVPPKNCVVIEDGISGMEAAKKAGMVCIGLINNKGNNEYPTPHLVNSLKEISWEYLQKIFY